MKQRLWEAKIEAPNNQNAIIELKQGKVSEMILGNNLYRIYSPEVEKKFRAAVENNEEENTLAIAKENLQTLYAQNFVPTFSIPRQYIDTILENGLTPKLTYIPGLKLLAGTIGIKYYNPEEDEARYLALVKDKKAYSQLKPRFTGPTAAFRGVISTEYPIPLEHLIIIDTQNMEIVYPKNIETEVLDEDKLVKRTRKEIQSILNQ